MNSKAILNKAVRRFPKNLLQKKRRNVYMNLHWKKAAALLLAGVLTAGTLSAFPAAAEDAVPSDTASAPTAAETVPESSTEEASPEPTEPETDTNGDQIPIDKHTPDFYDALTDDTRLRGRQRAQGPPICVSGLQRPHRHRPRRPCRGHAGAGHRAEKAGSRAAHH